jgi:spermidine synthase
MLLHTIIFISGAAILALELLASRIMTPYFGVSLYIWTGILSITLVSLALGYWAGGRLAGHGGHRREVGRLVQLYALMPAAAAITIVLACLVYPHAFAALANWDLLAGAFAACLILLFLPLVAASAMNTLLVAILLHRDTQRPGDAGAGRVFFTSTLGSVAGVLVTAFGLIPYATNYGAVLAVALTLALLSLAAAMFQPPPMRGRRTAGAAAIAAALLAGLLWWQADAYTGRLGPAAYGGSTWRVEASYGSLFGTVKILRSEPRANGQFLRIYFQDGLTQNGVDSTGKSESFYTYALEALVRAQRPDMRNALVLGLGAGMVPMRLADYASVAAVDIDPVAVKVAQRFFGFDPKKVRTYQADARAFLHHCPQRYDAIVVDLFHGDGTPEYLVTREFFSDLKRCLADDGVAVFNTFADLDQPVAYAHLLVTLRSELPHLALYRPDWGNAVRLNSFVVASAKPLGPLAKITLDGVPERHEATLWDMLAAPVAVTPALLQGGKVLTDALNPGAHDFARAQLTYRKAAVESLPGAFLLN